MRPENEILKTRLERVKDRAVWSEKAENATTAETKKTTGRRLSDLAFYSCRLETGRYVVVTSHEEVSQPFYVEKHWFSNLRDARYHAYQHNLRGHWKDTVFGPSEQAPLHLSQELEPGEESQPVPD
jgi:hypothetical protein